MGSKRLYKVYTSHIWWNFQAFVQVSRLDRNQTSVKRSGVINWSNKQKAPSTLTDAINCETKYRKRHFSPLTNYTKLKALCNQFAIIPLLRSTICLTNYCWNMYSRQLYDSFYSTIIEVDKISQPKEPIVINTVLNVSKQAQNQGAAIIIPAWYW